MPELVNMYNLGNSAVYISKIHGGYFEYESRKSSGKGRNGGWRRRRGEGNVGGGGGGGEGGG